MQELDLTPFKIEVDRKIEWWDTEPGDLLVLRQEQLYHFVRRQLTGEDLQSWDNWGDVSWEDFTKDGCFVIETVYRVDFKYPEEILVKG